MRKKSKNRGLVVVLMLSLFVLAGLLLFLVSQEGEMFFEHSFGVKQEQTGNPKEEYYLPTVKTKRVSVSYGTEVKPEMFIQSVESIYDVTYSYERAPDPEQYGAQDVVVLVTDAVGNSAAVKAKLNIINLKETLKLNMGASVPAAEEFLAEPGSRISYVTDISGIDTNIPQNYSVFFVVDGDYAQTTLSVDDYAAPEITTMQVEEWLNHPLDVEQFVDTVIDYSTVVDIRYETEPDWSLSGEQTVLIRATDEKGNSAVYEALMVLNADTKAPIVTAGNLDVTVGNVVSYRSVINYFDNASPESELKLEIDNSQVNLDEVGIYDVTYRVTDFAGNSTSVVAKVNVVEEEPVWNDEALIKEKAEVVLAKIISADMSDYEKAKAIHTWAHNNIRFINFSEKDNYARGVYEGLFLKKGDCFVYAATSKYLLTLAGVPNMDIKKSSTDPSHYWNLVYIEDGWYHFDACPTLEGVRVFLFTDAELEAFSASRGNSHVYNKSLYPEIK